MASKLWGCRTPPYWVRLSPFAAVGGALAADLPVKKAVLIEDVRVCTTCGAGFFYIPGTDTCLRVLGRARFEGGYQTSYSRQYGNNIGDTSGYQGRMRINLDAGVPPATAASASPAPSSASARPSRASAPISSAVSRNT